MATGATTGARADPSAAPPSGQDVRIDIDQEQASGSNPNPDPSTSRREDAGGSGDQGGESAGGNGGESADGETGGEPAEEEYVGGPKTFQQKAAAHNVMVTQYQVEEVIDIMKTNVEKILERDSKLSELEQRADTLNETAEAFQKSAGSLKNKMWLENMKQTIYMIILAAVLLFIGAKYLHLI